MTCGLYTIEILICTPDREIVWLISLKEDVGPVVKQLLESGILIDFLLTLCKAHLFFIFLVADVAPHVNQCHVANK